MDIAGAVRPDDGAGKIHCAPSLTGDFVVVAGHCDDRHAADNEGSDQTGGGESVHVRDGKIHQHHVHRRIPHWIRREMASVLVTIVEVHPNCATRVVNMIALDALLSTMATRGWLPSAVVRTKPVLFPPITPR
jgi:hypothetical protein